MPAVAPGVSGSAVTKARRERLLLSARERWCKLTPELILYSENDLRCNVEQAEQLFTTLRVSKRPVELVRFPAEGHELSRSGSPHHRVIRFEIILEWFDRHLKT